MSKFATAKALRFLLFLVAAGSACAQPARSKDSQSQGVMTAANAERVKRSKPASTPATSPKETPWDILAKAVGGDVGSRFTLTLPPGGPLSDRLWGTGVYTDDSSIGSAAVHAGIITVQSGGPVTIEISPGQPAYKGSSSNGVTSSSFGTWGRSFFIVGGAPPTIPATWNLTAVEYRGQNGRQFTFSIPPGGKLSRVWGFGVYTDDSSIATAAVHAGLISLQGGGTVTIEISPGQPTYKGSLNNGVTSSSYGAWAGSFVFVN